MNVLAICVGIVIGTTVGLLGNCIGNKRHFIDRFEARRDYSQSDKSYAQSQAEMDGA